MAGEKSALLGGGERRRTVRPALVAAATCLAVVGCVALVRGSQIAAGGGRSVLKALNPGLRSGAEKDPDDPWGYLTPTCRGLPTCSSSTSSPAIKRHQNALARGVLAVSGKKAAVQHKTTAMSQTAAPVTPAKQADLSMKQQYAKIIEQQGYFAPWSRQNLWNNRLAIDNIRKNNTPQALAAKQAQIKAEDLKFHAAFDTPHTAKYTGKHETVAAILDPKYQPWANQAPRKAYYSGF